MTEGHRPLTRYEKVELDALVFYAAKLKGLDEVALRRDIENHAGVVDFNDLTEADYLSAKSYLQSKIN